MLNNKKICVVLPAFNAGKTLIQTYQDIPEGIVDRIILVDDASTDQTFAIANELPIDTYLHLNNLGYGANQKTCYNKALEQDTDIVIMLHPDYQYTPKLIVSMAAMIAYDVYDVVLGSRILVDSALKSGMPLYKYISNRVLTFLQNLMVGKKLSEYHTGYRAFSRQVLEKIPFTNNSNDFVFDNQFIVQAIAGKLRIGEISCPTKYFPEASSINFIRSLKYGLGCLWISFRYLLHRMRIVDYRLVKF
ncbi:MAG: glycosyltransferase family 2 protein [Candidatus Marinimicrobia bacterium]|nr:glycosyltransferase family 2 protein [Candidatus Neomarinimicrobiota bacterium]